VPTAGGRIVVSGPMVISEEGADKGVVEVVGELSGAGTCLPEAGGTFDV